MITPTLQQWAMVQEQCRATSWTIELHRARLKHTYWPRSWEIICLVVSVCLSIHLSVCLGLWDLRKITMMHEIQSKISVCLSVITIKSCTLRSRAFYKCTLGRPSFRFTKHILRWCIVYARCCLMDHLTSTQLYCEPRKCPTVQSYIMNLRNSVPCEPPKFPMPCTTWVHWPCISQMGEEVGREMTGSRKRNEVRPEVTPVWSIQQEKCIETLAETKPWELEMWHTLLHVGIPLYAQIKFWRHLGVIQTPPQKLG